MRCGKCGEEGHMRRDCTNEERTYTFTNEEGETKEMYALKAHSSQIIYTRMLRDKEEDL